MSAPEIANEIADAVATARHQLGLTQLEVAELTGVPRAQVIKTEQADVPAYLTRLVAILDVCGLELRVERRTHHIATPTA